MSLSLNPSVDGMLQPSHLRCVYMEPRTPRSPVHPWKSLQILLMNPGWGSLALYRPLRTWHQLSFSGGTKWGFSFGRVNGSVLGELKGESAVYKQAWLEFCISNSSAQWWSFPSSVPWRYLRAYQKLTLVLEDEVATSVLPSVEFT
jgi:hypothetical protein